ncbi:thioesterase family protein [Simiduia curdlanivorans]|uniref:Acyl-CoA thioesterase n=1 Tax=Simiduia curdlanivorans TaxID=1492769 RepID=A0ABV8V612_9GAMM|nr:thioesterase family protein [Simiduia curdlanivorans]MDN3638690.1 thioesterase family protein [Simiduia curdlanivorans]
MSKPNNHKPDAKPSRASFQRFQPIDTRWADNDIYGHVNNVTYYAYFDTAVNQFLISDGGLDIHQGECIAFVVDSQCSYLQPLSFPEKIEVGLAVAKLGTSSITYQLGIFKEGKDTLCAYGHFVHVFVARDNQRPCPIPDSIRRAVTPLLER